MAINAINGNDIVILKCKPSVASKRIGLKTTTHIMTSHLIIRFSKSRFCLCVWLWS